MNFIGTWLPTDVPLCCCCPAQILFALVEQALKSYDVSQFGVAENLFATGPFWFIILVCGLVSFGHRFIERALVWLFRPQVLPPLLPCPAPFFAPCQVFPQAPRIAVSQLTAHSIRSH